MISAAEVSRIKDIILALMIVTATVYVVFMSIVTIWLPRIIGLKNLEKHE